MVIQLKKLRDSATTPTYGSEEAACFDLYAAEDVDIRIGETRKIPLGFAMGINKGYEVVIRPRSGMSLKTSIRIANSPGTIDSDYKGEIMIILQNTGEKMYSVKVGDRIAQGKHQRVEKTNFVFVESLSPSRRNDNAFGSTGK
jgi:dUTP pyrophosphatase